MGRWDNDKKPDTIELMKRAGWLKETMVHPVTRGLMVRCEYCNDWRYFGVCCNRCILNGVLCSTCGNKRPCKKHES